MEVTYKTTRGNLVFKFDAANHKEVFNELHGIQEVFEEEKCGACGANDLMFVHRTSSKGKQVFDYYEVKCRKCHCKLEYGQLSDGSNKLFPKRKGEDGAYKKNNGWEKWVPETPKGE